ncbi:PHP domain-containing protein [bacterium]|nr:PHP domain-containing protein [bacterium]
MGYKELIKSFTKDNFHNNVNLHIHSSFSDGIMTPEDIVNQAKSKGFEYISITDHNNLDGYLKTDLSNESMVISGIEFDCWYGTTFFHLLGYGFDINTDLLNPFLAKNKKDTEADYVRIFAKRDIKKLIPAIHDAGGIAVLAHPACYWCLNLEGFVKQLMSFGLDGIEVYYPYERHRGIIKFHSRKTVEKIADKYNLIKTGGTDCHGSELH